MLLIIFFDFITTDTVFVDYPCYNELSKRREGDTMFTLFLLCLYFCFTGLLILVFQYYEIISSDSIVVFCSLFGGLLLTAFVAYVILQTFYLFLQKNKIQSSLFMHKLLKQIVSVPLHFLLLRIKVVGKENLPKDTGFTMYSNHVSWYDPIVISYGLYQYKVVALGKEGAFALPVVGKFAPLFGSVMIHRDDPRQSAQAIKTVIQRVNDGFPMLIFPEGTRNKNHELLEFKAGAFKVALKTRKPLVPITLIEQKRKLFKGITIHIHQAIYPDEFLEFNSHQLAEHVREIVGRKK